MGKEWLKQQLYPKYKFITKSIYKSIFNDSYLVRAISWIPIKFEILTDIHVHKLKQNGRKAGLWACKLANFNETSFENKVANCGPLVVVSLIVVEVYACSWQFDSTISNWPTICQPSFLFKS